MCVRACVRVCVLELPGLNDQLPVLITVCCRADSLMLAGLELRSDRLSATYEPGEFT